MPSDPEAPAATNPSSTLNSKPRHEGRDGRHRLRVQLGDAALRGLTKRVQQQSTGELDTNIETPLRGVANLGRRLLKRRAPAFR
jgi:hypothetical protein